VLQHFWIGLVGRSEFRVRLLSALTGILTLPLLFVVGRRLFGSAAGAAAALIGAVAPIHIALSQSARGYTLLAFLSLLSLWLLYEAWGHGGWRWAGYVAATAGVLYTHNWGLFLLLAQNGFALWRLVTRREWSRRLWPWVAAQVCIGLLYAPWVPVLLQQLKIIAVLPFIPVPTPAQKLWELAGALLAPWPALLLWLALLVLGVLNFRSLQDFGSLGDFGSLSLGLFCSLGTLAVGLLVSLATYGQVPSYVAFAALPALYLLLGRGLTRLRPAWIAVPLAALVLAFSLLGIGPAGYPFRSTLREVALAVEAQAGPDDMIVIAPDYLSPTFNMYYQGQQPQIAFPWVMRRQEWIDCVGWNERWERAAEALPATLDAIAAHRKPAGRLWLVAAVEDFPDDTQYYGQIRRLKAELDDRYMLERTLDDFRGAPEWATIYVYGLKRRCESC